MQATTKVKAVIAVVILGIVVFSITKLPTQGDTSTVAVGDTGTGTNPPVSSVPATTPMPVTPTPVTTPVPTPVVTPTSRYKDGTYSSTGNYDSPAGTESIGVTVTLKNDIITSSSVVAQANDGTSHRYQSTFISNYKQYVTGKNIDQVSIGRVSGSSLTGAGFNAALAKIKAQAQA